MMNNMYGPYTLFELGLTDPALIDSLSLYNHPRFTAGGYAGLRDLMGKSSGESDASPPRHRHDGTSPLPLGIDWSPPPRVWDGQNTVWPHDFHTGWSYCVTIPSWSLSSDSRASESVVLYEVLVGIQSPQGITTTRGIQRRFSDFVTLSYDLRKEFPKKKLPPAPRRGLLRIKSNDLLEERRRLLEDWMTEVLSDIDLSRSLSVAIFIELEAAVRSAFNESNNSVPDEDSPISGVVLSLQFSNPHQTTSSPELPDVSGALKTLDEPMGSDIQSTKVKNLETEAESAEQSSEGILQQPVLTEREQLTKMLWDMDELRRKCLEIEASLKAEQDEKLQALSINCSILQENEKLRQELDAAHQQLKSLQKHKESDLDSKTDLELLVKEVESLKSSNSEMMQELSILTRHKTEVEAILHEERQSREQTDAVNAKLLHQCMVLRTGLEECSVNFHIDNENKLIMDTPSPSDAIDILVTSDNQIGLLLAEVELLAQDVETAVVTSNGDDSGTRNTELRRVLTDLLTDCARLRKQVNSVLSCALCPPTRSEKVEEESTPTKTVLH